MAQLAFYGFSALLLLSALAVVFARNPVHSVLFLILAFFNAAGLFVLVGAEFLAMILVIVYVGAVAVLFLFVVMMLRISPQTQRPFFSKSNFRHIFLTLRLFVYYLSIFLLIFGLLISLPVIADLAQQGYLNAGKFTQFSQAFFNSSWLVIKGTKGIIYSSLIILVASLIARQAAQFMVRHSFLSILSGFADSLPFLLLLGIAITGYFVIFGLKWASSSYSEEMTASAIPPIDLMANTQALGQVIYSEYVFAFQAAGIILLIAMVGAITLSLRQRDGVKHQNVRAQLSRSPENTLVLKKVPIGKGI